MRKHIILIVGTRPEAIKMAPVYFALVRNKIPVKVCATFQHGTLLQEVFDIFGITPDFNLNIMKSGQDIFYLTQQVLEKTKNIFEQEDPALVLVHGDTASAFAAALSAYYLKIPVGHVEAGLRTHDIYSPFPEEFNRQAIGLIARFNFAPTDTAVKALRQYGAQDDTIFCTGNTIVDVLHMMQEKISKKYVDISPAILDIVEQCEFKKQNKVLLTVHRRESFNGGIDRVLETVKEYALEHPESCFIYPYHPNPVVKDAIVRVGLSEVENIYMCEPLPYSDLVYLLLKADLVVTDSGGIQEEAISLGKTVLVAREKSERMEGVHAGIAHLVGTDKKVIRAALDKFIGTTHQEKTNIYGNGDAAEKIVEIIEKNGIVNEESLCCRSGVYRVANSDHSC
ncbi:MAG TPA: UDP-N-acetylglucosamine 2-epimerase (non-hydrolyzing) [Candidatus Babeliales bacterium]|nr:UDP-N-acetylglucosamine 2-epimerase (non-hydrolyzing) [Candidatus Babeliales bacterium]